MKIEIRETLDGSHTLYLEGIDEHYHSTYGAIQESEHVFIQAGLSGCQKGEVSLFEIGFGTGLNCYLTLLAAQNSGQRIKYYAIEKFPLSLEVCRKLNYGNLMNNDSSEIFSALHKAPWNQECTISNYFHLHKMEGDLLAINFDLLPAFDLIYFDAFSPEKQPELWEQEVFERLFAKMKNNSIIVTYCAKGMVRRKLQTVGFEVERIPGPPGKREMIRATKRSAEN